MSPLLFNLVGDGLASMLSAAREVGEIRGLVPHLVEGGLTHLQYADNTIIFLNLDEQSVITVKIILFYFEALSGLKINYQKSDVLVVGGSKEENSVANMLGCKVGKLPIKYLGIMVDQYHLSAKDLCFVYQKVEKRLPTWQCNTVSYGGKMILVESCLSSILNYTMGIYLLQEEIHQKVDATRSSFFWHGPGLKGNIIWQVGISWPN